jgi:anti-sigma factor (TIGR02949 family)
MSCPDRNEELNAFLDGELPIAQAADLAAHLASCPDCARTLAELARLRAALARVLPMEEPPAELKARIEAALDAEARRRQDHNVLPFRLRGKAIAVFGAAAAAVAALAIVVFSPRDESHELMAVRDAALRTSLAQTAVDPHSAPTVRGFKLAAARADVVAGHQARVLVYSADGTRITLCVWPANGEAAHGVRTADYQGTEISYWNDGRDEYWATSAKPGPTLTNFVRAFGAG